MPPYPFPYGPGPTAADPIAALIFLVILLLMIGVVAILSIWYSHHEEKKHRTGHQH